MDYFVNNDAFMQIQFVKNGYIVVTFFRHSNVVNKSMTFNNYKTAKKVFNECVKAFYDK